MSSKVIIRKLNNIVKKEGLENTAFKVGISTGHFHKLINRPDQYRISKKMGKRIEESGVFNETETEDKSQN